jgi:hypothetical protein
VGWSHSTDEYQPGYSPEATKYREDLKTKTEEVESLKCALEEERLAWELDQTKHVAEIASLSSDLTMVKLSQPREKSKITRERDEAVATLLKAQMAYDALLLKTSTMSSDAFARKSVKAFHTALMECKALRNCTPATKPQGWVSLDYLACVPVNGVYISVLPLDAGDDKSQFNWRAIRQGLHYQIIKLRSHLADATQEYYSEASDLPELDELIRCLAPKSRPAEAGPPPKT